jgi:uncharacterized protein YecT (DUF1311 family)
MIASLTLSLLLQSDMLPNPNWNCEDPQVQQEMNWCAGQDFQAADKALNAQWRLTREAMKARDVEWNATGRDNRPGWFATLLESQRGWLRYRDGHCALAGYKARGGSLEPLLVLTCKAQATRVRTEKLEELAQSPG